MRPARRAGFTLVELLIALAIFGVVIAQAFAVFGAQHVTYTGTERSIEVQQDVRLVADAMLSDIRMAGYMVPRIAGIASVDGGTTSADVICVSDPAKIDDAEVDKATERFDGADVAVAVNAGDGAVTLGSLDVDGDTDADFAAGEGIIIADGTSSHCALITAVAGNVVTFTPVTPVGFVASIGSGTAVPAIRYEVSGSDLRRNGLRLSTQVEDIQLEFGIDGDGDGQLAAGEYLNVLNGADPLDLLAVRLSVIARADRADDDLQLAGRPAAANRTAGAADGFRRRRVTASILPRNLL
ncbi:MAG: prepilin-type N-terminal cleavage/methylation domain-containing protein [Myxococcota bacterium]